ncbi:nicotinamide mononucleotide transporter PnuC [Ruminococcus flavefaciens]|uniref:Nicotinamide mononucleotide transporter PnuC n=1 Tax=Ruminococcus flavefaciens TaxID=1265 RepID=A0A1H6KIV0_RUMFL|nr:nicotinamide riboside transporter PnuC [Ruminococcus flavefaciens]SEH71810.1 nicotinamide mononucleotide transporter PnuC [Ruminococcus flavefaciens]
MLKQIKDYFSKGELMLWGISTLCVLISFFMFDRENYLALSASLIGVTYLILNAKGNPIGQVLVIIFSLLYGIISYSFSYYGEMVTYLGMTMPMAVFALISWLRNPFNGNKSEVTVNSISRREAIFMSVLMLAVTILFFFILQAFGTANIFPSTLSVATSFIAVYLTFRRSPFYAVAYAANDIVLIVLWIMASIADTRYISVVVCFSVFLINDIYSFFSWQNMRKRQMAVRNKSIHFEHTKV